MPPTASVLIIDDDPTHLEIYRLIVESAGLRGLPVLAHSRGIEFPDDEPVHAVLLDYRLAPNLAARRIALEAKKRYPFAPIVILSDIYETPAEMADLVQGFVRKGDPANLLRTLQKLIEESSGKISSKLVETPGNSLNPL